ncbi:MAG: SDR family oxidoreductase, partial [Oleiharenicola lentus]
MPQLTGQVVIITGASAGIGEETARRLVRGGAKVVITARRPDRLNALAHALDPTGANVLAVAGDITSDADRRKLVAATLEKFGRIDGLVNNAGYGTRGPVEIVPVDLVRTHYSTTIFSLLALTQLVVPAMRERGSGCIVNIGSVAGIRDAGTGQAAYAASKAGQLGLTVELAGTYGRDNIRVNAVLPG